jgi:hypothetical protein
MKFMKISIPVIAVSVLLLGVPMPATAQNQAPRTRAEARQMAREAVRQARIAADEATAAAAQARARANAARVEVPEPARRPAVNIRQSQAAARARPEAAAPAYRQPVAPAPRPAAPAYRQPVAPAPPRASSTATAAPVLLSAPPGRVLRTGDPLPAARPMARPVPAARAAMQALPASPRAQTRAETRAQASARRQQEILAVVTEGMGKRDVPRVDAAVVEARETDSSFETKDGLIVY